MPLEGTRLGEHDAVEYLESAPIKWESTVNKTFRCVSCVCAAWAAIALRHPLAVSCARASADLSRVPVRA